MMSKADETWSPDWVVPLADLSQVPIPDVKKDELIHHMFEFAREHFDYGHSSQTRLVAGRRVDEWKFNTSNNLELPRLWVVSEPGMLSFLVAGSASSEADEIDAWKVSVSAGLERLGTRKEVEWLAILVERPHWLLSGHRLSGSANVADLHFARLTDGLAEETTGNGPIVGLHMSYFYHWPIELRGTTSCYSWEQDGQAATFERRRRLTAVLSLYWDANWQLREGPRDPRISFANSVGPLMGSASKPIASSIPATGRPVAVPEWLGVAEETAEEKHQGSIARY